MTIRARSSNEIALWAFVAVLTFVGVAGLAAFLWDMPALATPFNLPWWSVAAGYALAEVLVVHLQFRRDTHSFSISEVPFVVGLFFLSPAGLLLALLLGSGTALALHRRQSRLKLAFNLANLTVAAEVGITIFRAIVRTGDPLGLAGWVGAFVAAIGADLTSLIAIGVAVRLATGKASELRKLLGSGAIVAFFNTCLALVFVTTLWVRPEASWLALVLTGLMVVAYRVYGSVRLKHESLELLYDSTRSLQGAPDHSALVETLLRQAQEMFRSERVSVLLFGADGEPTMELAIEREGGATATQMNPDLDAREGIWARIASEASGLAFPRPISNVKLRAYFAERGIRDLVVAPIFSGDRVVGLIQVANRIGALTYDDDDLRLLETFAGQASAALENARLIGRLRRQAELSEHQASHDSLTGLANRVEFRSAIERKLSDDERPFAVALLDLDKFKEVNDTLGHHVGDLLLRAVADRLSASARPTDVVARLGGDEFGILLVDVPGSALADRFARDLHARLSPAFEIQEMTLEVHASVGIALSPLHGEDADTLIQRADVAMYQAKAELLGHAIYEPARDPYSPTRLLLVSELRRAIEHAELTVAFQPQFELVSGRLSGAEALVRWTHPRRGVISPEEFVPIAEHTGLLKPMTMHVLDTALAACARWRERMPVLTVAVNLSVRNLLDIELPADVRRLLERHRLSPDALELEVTESALIADPTRSHRVLQELRGIGVGISIDDYGAGYSSLAYLRRMPIDELKIDRSFVTGMIIDENDALIVESTIELSHKLGLLVTAEGVETELQRRRLADLGCDRAQGFALGRPMTADAFRRLIMAAPPEGDARVPMPPISIRGHLARRRPDPEAAAGAAAR